MSVVARWPAPGQALSSAAMSGFGIHSHRAEEALRRLITSGSFASGAPLPAERQLAEQLQVGRVAVRRAVARLEADGWIRRSGGYRRVVVGPAPAAPAEAAPLRGHRSLARTVCVLERVLHVRGAKPAPGWIDWIPVGMAERLSERDLEVVAFDPTGGTEEAIDRLIHERPLGLLIPESPTIAGYEALRDRMLVRLPEARIPLVICGDAPGMEQHDRIVTDHESGWYEATRWLLARGCKRPVAMVYPEGWWFERRLAGYRRALREARLEPLRLLRLTRMGGMLEWEHPDRDQSVAYYLAGLLRERVVELDALLLPTDLYVRPAAAALRLLGRDPATVPLVGYDNIWGDIADQLGQGDRPTLTVDRRNRDAGRAAVDLLCERLDGKLPQAAQRRLLPPALIVPGQPAAAPPRTRK
jgi:DNA-binding LacI/PurR family transcriptional regulator